ncbi:hypothetical protein AAFF_G00424860 [Aldrovandia affinis]|uniref:Uncharacterized protein n=1 Tax=Aldrovandia affinis TaxID=143900 RepID=A0AAD7T8F1_9TELE|nr:hypothetical protein AAFF_G00424860 [Aldrovandia affinis]
MVGGYCVPDQDQGENLEDSVVNRPVPVGQSCKRRLCRETLSVQPAMIEGPGALGPGLPLSGGRVPALQTTMRGSVPRH